MEYCLHCHHYTIQVNSLALTSILDEHRHREEWDTHRGVWDSMIAMNVHLDLFKSYYECHHFVKIEYCP